MVAKCIEQLRLGLSGASAHLADSKRGAGECRCNGKRGQLLQTVHFLLFKVVRELQGLVRARAAVVEYPIAVSCPHVLGLAMPTLSFKHGRNARWCLSKRVSVEFLPHQVVRDPDTSGPGENQSMICR